MEKKCYLCGKILEGRRLKFCSDEHRKEYNREKYNEYMRRYRAKSRKIEYCKYCGKILPKYKKRFCSYICRMDFINMGETPRDKIVKNATMELYIPNKCEECGGEVMVDGYDVVCVNCGLIQE